MRLQVLMGLSFFSHGLPPALAEHSAAISNAHPAHICVIGVYLRIAPKNEAPTQKLLRHLQRAIVLIDHTHQQILERRASLVIAEIGLFTLVEREKDVIGRTGRQVAVDL